MTDDARPARTPHEAFERWRASGGPGDWQPDPRAVEQGIAVGWEAAMKLAELIPEFVRPQSRPTPLPATNSPFPVLVTIQVAEDPKHMVLWPFDTMLVIVVRSGGLTSLVVNEELAREEPDVVGHVLARHLRRPPQVPTDG